MIFSKIRNEKVAGAVVQQIEDLIVEGVLRPGSQLPAERELAKKLDVSRPSLREAIKELEKRGLLITRHGGGTFVGNVIRSIFADEFIYLFHSNERAIADYIEFRRDMDILAASRAADRATETDKEILTKIQALMIDAIERKDENNIVRCDIDFHIAVAGAAHNVLLLHSMRSIFEQMVPFCYGRLPREPNAILMGRIVNQHQAILQAILDGNIEAASRAAEAHGKFINTTMRDADIAYLRENTAQRRFEMMLEGLKHRRNAKRSKAG